MPLALFWPVLMLHVIEKYLHGLLEHSSGNSTSGCSEYYT